MTFSGSRVSLQTFQLSSQRFRSALPRESLHLSIRFTPWRTQLHHPLQRFAMHHGDARHVLLQVLLHRRHLPRQHHWIYGIKLSKPLLPSHRKLARLLPRCSKIMALWSPHHLLLPIPQYGTLLQSRTPALRLQVQLPHPRSLLYHTLAPDRATPVMTPADDTSSELISAPSHPLPSNAKINLDRQ